MEEAKKKNRRDKQKRRSLIKRTISTYINLDDTIHRNQQPPHGDKDEIGKDEKDPIKVDSPSAASQGSEFDLQYPPIGTGAYGKVYKANWYRQSSITTTALKIFPLDVSESRSAFEAEVQMGMILKNNEYCVKVQKAFVSENKGYIVMELLKQDLLEYQPKINMNERKVANIFKQICVALNKLHRNRVVHMDLKLDNVLLDQDQKVFLGDFGSSAVVPNGGKFRFPAGTVEYAAPEVLSGEAYCPFRADIWSLGICLYTMMTGKHPKIRKKKGYTADKKLSSDCNNLLGQILQYQPLNRPGCDEILNHPWLSSRDSQKPSSVNKNKSRK